jgi:hypothetical protein
VGDIISECLGDIIGIRSHALAPLLSFRAWLSFNTTSPPSAKAASLAR